MTHNAIALPPSLSPSSLCRPLVPLSSPSPLLVPSCSPLLCPWSPCPRPAAPSRLEREGRAVVGERQVQACLVACSGGLLPAMEALWKGLSPMGQNDSESQTPNSIQGEIKKERPREHGSRIGPRRGPATEQIQTLARYIAQHTMALQMLEADPLVPPLVPLLSSPPVPLLYSLVPLLSPSCLLVLMSRVVSLSLPSSSPSRLSCPSYHLARLVLISLIRQAVKLYLVHLVPSSPLSPACLYLFHLFPLVPFWFRLSPLPVIHLYRPRHFDLP